MSKKDFSVLKKCALFDNVNVEETLDSISSGIEIVEFETNETVYTRSRFNDSVGFVLSGNVEVYKDERKLVMLNRISAGGFFGAAALFADKKEYVSVIVAKGDCTILFITFETFKELLRVNPDFSLNYIRFLSGRIEFLNKKIDEFTAGDTAEKLVMYLLDNSKEVDGRCVCKVKSMVELSKSLNMGRASLYRSFEELEGQGTIFREGKDIIIKDINKLKKRGF